MSTEGIERRFVSQEIYQLLRQQILTGELAAGTALKDQHLASRYRVSRTPVREALLKLEAENLVETKPNRWTQVTTLDLVAAAQRYPIIWSLEVLSVKLLPARLTDEQVHTMQSANQGLARALADRHPITAAEMDHNFHQVIVKAAQNPELDKIITQLKTPLQRIEIAYFDHLLLSDPSLNEHQAIIAAFKNGQSDRAIEAIEANWKNSLNRLFQLIDSEKRT